MSPILGPRISASGLALLYLKAKAQEHARAQSQNLCLWAGIAIHRGRFLSSEGSHVPESLPLGWHCYGCVGRPHLRAHGVPESLPLGWHCYS
jgi:hypothetical protein